MRRAHFVAPTAVAALLASALFAAELAPAEFKTKPARDAAAAYAGASERLVREYHDKLAIARRQYVTALTAAQAEATRAANLDEAVRIRDTIAAVQKEAPAAAPPKAPRNALLAGRDALAAQLAGTVWEQRGRKFRFNADGTVTVADDAKLVWEWTAIAAGEVVIRYPGGWTNAFKFDDKLATFTATEYGNGTKFKDDGKRATP